jgi:predicted transcriptional regulator
MEYINMKQRGAMIVVCEVCNHHNVVTKKNKRRPRTEQLLYENIYNYFNLLQEPKNKYELSTSISTNNKVVNSFVDEHISKGNVKPFEHNPNKYMLTIKGKRILYMVKELNKFLPYWESSIQIPYDPEVKRRGIKKGKNKKKYERSTIKGNMLNDNGI